MPATLIFPLQQYSLLGSHNYKLQAACKQEGFPIPPWQVRFTTMCTYRQRRHRIAFQFWRQRVRVLLSFDWLASPFRGKFNFGQERKRTYTFNLYCTHLIGWHPRRSAVNPPEFAIWNFARGDCYRWGTCLSLMHARLSPPVAHLYVSHMYANFNFNFNLSSIFLILILILILVSIFKFNFWF